MIDMLVITAPIDGEYPSVNHTGRDSRRFGRKTEAYKNLFNDIKTVAGIEMERCGWKTTADQCEVTVTRYVRDRRKRDASNLAKCEFDALTAAEVWQDDSQATRVTLEIVQDFEGRDRVTITVRRRFIPLIAREVQVAAERERRPRPTLKSISGSQAQAGERPAFVNGKQISAEEGRQMIRGVR